MALPALQDVFRCHREKATGLWKLGQDPHRTIYFDSGDIVFAQSTHPQDRLTYMLVERGKLTQAQLDYAMGNLKPGKSIGKNLIEMGFITQRDLLEVARAQVERVVAGAIGALDEEPIFQPKGELDVTVVRLPFFTPELLLNAILSQNNREAMLEMLGPLNQVVMLQGRRLAEIDLPPDLAKLSPLLDGTHTLLELSRESMAEPLRLGAFALFLREMGWARLHEMPPMDKGALDLAFTAEPEPLSPELPELALPQAPSLFSTIQAAAMPTTNLEHLSQALDAISGSNSEPRTAPELVMEPHHSVDDGDGSSIERFEVATGQAILPTPSLTIAIPEEESLEPEPAPADRPEVGQLDSEETILVFHPPQNPEVVVLPPTIAPPQLTLQEGTQDEDPLSEEAYLPKGRNPMLVGAAITGLLGVVAYIGWRVMRNNWIQKRTKPAVVQPVRPVAAEPAPIAPPVADQVKPIDTQEGAPSSQVKPEQDEKPDPAKNPPTGSPVAFSTDDRLEALQKGNLALSVQQGEAFRRGLPPERWTLRLVIASKPETIRNVVLSFEQDKPDLWVLPWKPKDGRFGYQLFLGSFSNRAATEKHIQQLPQKVLAGVDKPRIYRLSEIQDR